MSDQPLAEWESKLSPVAAEIATYLTTVSSAFAEPLESAIRQRESELWQRMDSWGDELELRASDALESLNSYRHGVESLLDEVPRRVDQAFDRTRSDIAALLGTIEAAHKESIREIRAARETIDADRNATLASAESALRGALEEFQAFSASAVQRMEAVEARLDRLNGAVDAKTRALERQIASDGEETAGSLGALDLLVRAQTTRTTWAVAACSIAVVLLVIFSRA